MSKRPLNPPSKPPSWVGIPHVKGSDTSLAAAKSVSEGDEKKVYDFIVICGAYGATDQEIETAFGMLHQTASARRWGLLKKALISDSGLRRPNKRTRRLMTVWVASSASHVVDSSTNELHVKPTSEDISAAISNMNDFIVHASGTNGPEFGDELRKVAGWLAWVGRKSVKK